MRENKKSRNNLCSEVIDVFAYVVSFVQRAEKLRAHIQSIIFKVLRTNESSPNSIFPNKFEHINVANTNMIFGEPLPIIVTINPLIRFDFSM